jgi:hypothetical protein
LIWGYSTRSAAPFSKAATRQRTAARLRPSILGEKSIHVEEFVNGAATDEEQYNRDDPRRPGDPLQDGIENGPRCGEVPSEEFTSTAIYTARESPQAEATWMLASLLRSAGNL